MSVLVAGLDEMQIKGGKKRRGKRHLHQFSQCSTLNVWSCACEINLVFFSSLSTGQFSWIHIAEMLNTFQWLWRTTSRDVQQCCMSEHHSVPVCVDTFAFEPWR